MLYCVLRNEWTPAECNARNACWVTLVMGRLWNEHKLTHWIRRHVYRHRLVHDDELNNSYAQHELYWPHLRRLLTHSFAPLPQAPSPPKLNENLEVVLRVIAANRVTHPGGCSLGSLLCYKRHSSDCNNVILSEAWTRLPIIAFSWKWHFSQSSLTHHPDGKTGAEHEPILFACLCVLGVCSLEQVQSCPPLPLIRTNVNSFFNEIFRRLRTEWQLLDRFNNPNPSCVFLLREVKGLFRELCNYAYAM